MIPRLPDADNPFNVMDDPAFRVRMSVCDVLDTPSRVNKALAEHETDPEVPVPFTPIKECAAPPEAVDAPIPDVDSTPVKDFNASEASVNPPTKGVAATPDSVTAIFPPALAVMTPRAEEIRTAGKATAAFPDRVKLPTVPVPVNPDNV